MTPLTFNDAQPILIVEDSPEDFEMAQRGLRKVGLANPIIHVTDGEQALNYLFQRGEFEDASAAPRPGIVLLDLNLPGIDGRDVLDEIKASPDLKMIPVIIMTTSGDETDVVRCYKAGSNSYVRKPLDFNGFVDALRKLVDYWFTISLLPKRQNHQEVCR